MTLTRTMHGEVGRVGEAFHLVVSPDRFGGPDFEYGLAQLKGIAEQSAPAGTAAATAQR